MTWDFFVRLAINVALALAILAVATHEYDSRNGPGIMAFMLGGVAGVIPATVIEHRWRLSGAGAKGIFAAGFGIGGAIAFGLWTLFGS